jgi:hypothetical protein
MGSHIVCKIGTLKRMLKIMIQTHRSLKENYVVNQDWKNYVFNTKLCITYNGMPILFQEVKK